MAKYTPEERIQVALRYLIPDHFLGQLYVTADEGGVHYFDIDGLTHASLTKQLLEDFRLMSIIDKK